MEKFPVESQRHLRATLLNAAVFFFEELDEQQYTWGEHQEIKREYEEIFINVEGAIFPAKDDTTGHNPEIQNMLVRLADKFRRINA